ncbi:MAG: hypothetical protein H0T62_06015 [Parachlamydiaceae bacterium]|nr:hypothetical protein [Parachlamydiaceae bacterium]
MNSPQESEESSIDASFFTTVVEGVLDEVKEKGEAEREAIEKAAEFKAVAEATSLKASEVLEQNIFTVLISEFDPQSKVGCILNFRVKCYQECMDLNTQVGNLIIQLKEHVERDVKPVYDMVKLEREQNPMAFRIIPMPNELSAQISIIMKSAVKDKDQNLIDKIVYYFLENTEYLPFQEDLFELIEIDSVEKAGIVEKYLSTQIYEFQIMDQNNIDLGGKLAKFRTTLL